MQRVIKDEELERVIEMVEGRQSVTFLTLRIQRSSILGVNQVLGLYHGE